jgi:Flp pilus assembly pilin Flp
MGKKGKLASFIGDEEGQAVIEYILMLSVVVGMVSMIGFGFRKTLFKLWGSFTRDIAAGCPGCPADSKYNLR